MANTILKWSHHSYSRAVSRYKIVQVGEADRERVARSLKSEDLLVHHFDIYDLLYEPENTTMYVAYDQISSLSGYLLTYRRLRTPATRLYGEREAVSQLLDLLEDEKMLIFCTPELLDVVEKRFPQARCYLEDQMYVSRSLVRFINHEEAVRLDPEHTSSLAELYSSGESSYARSEERCRTLLEKHVVYSVFADDQLVSAAITLKRLPEVSEITGVFTRPKFRGRGLTTIATSAATEEALKNAPKTTLFVRSDNIPAVKIYKKLGYRKVCQWYWVDIGTGLRP